MGIQHIIEVLMQNQFATGFGATAILGAVLYRLKAVPQKLLDLALLCFTVHFTVSEKVEAYKWLDEWLSTLPYARKTSRVMLVSKRSGGFMTDDGEDTDTPKWYMTPGPGNHYFFWNKRIVRMSRGTAENAAPKDGAVFKPAEINIRILGRSQTIVRDMVEQAYAFSVRKVHAKICIWSGDWWRKVYGKRLRGLNSVILPKGQMERIIADVKWFQENEAYHIECNIPYRRGYLFKGKPGTGKTSFVMALAAHFDKTICVLSLSSIMSDKELFDAVYEAERNALILIEDVDCVQASETRLTIKEGDKTSDNALRTGVTKAGLLNVLDGVTTPDGRIFILTTNHPEKLDPALIRRGRCDVHEEFGYFGKDEQIRMAERFYGPNRFVPIDAELPPAKMQAAFTQYFNDPEGARHWLLTDSSEYEPVPIIPQYANEEPDLV